MENIASKCVLHCVLKVFFKKLFLFYILFYFKLIFFLCADIKNNFKKIKKNIILMCFEMKNTLKNNHYHIPKHTRSSLIT